MNENGGWTLCVLMFDIFVNAVLVFQVNSVQGRAKELGPAFGWWAA